MQQVSNILLGNSNKTASSSNENLSQGADNNSFLSALNQASQSDVKKVNIDKIDASKDIPSETNTAEEADVDLIFAQIDLAENFEGSNLASEDGNVLPLTFQNTDDELLLEGENSHLNEKFGLDNELPIADLLLTDITLSEAEADLANIDDTDTNVAESLEALSSEQLDALSKFTSMNKEQLSLLTPNQLNQLITDFNQQNLLSPDTELLSIPLITDTAKTLQASNNTSIQQTESAKAIAAFNKSNSSTQQVDNNIVDADKTLGDADSQDGKISPKDSTVNLSKAELSVSVDKSVVQSSLSNNTGSPNSALTIAGNSNNPLTAGELSVDLEPIDVKSIQNQSSLTAPHKSDVPQFQLSLRQGNESAVQMQDMIQKFAPVMKQQLITMVSQGVQQAEIRLDPAELGHMVVRVQVNGDQTQVQFQVAQTQTRDLIEQAIPRLRDMLAEEGLQLADSQVSQDGEKNQKSDYDEANGSGESHLDEISAQELELTTKHALSGNSAIDYYA